MGLLGVHGSSPAPPSLPFGTCLSARTWRRPSTRRDCTTSCCQWPSWRNTEFQRFKTARNATAQKATALKATFQKAIAHKATGQKATAQKATAQKQLLKRNLSWRVLFPQKLNIYFRVFFKTFLSPKKMIYDLSHFQEILSKLRKVGHNVTMSDVLFGAGYSGCRVQAIAVQVNISKLKKNFIIFFPHFAKLISKTKTPSLNLQHVSTNSILRILLSQIR